MSRVFWLSLLLGYLAGIAIAIVFLPDPVVEPFYGALALGSVALVGGVSTLLAFAGSRSRDEPAAPGPVTVATRHDAGRGQPHQAPGAGERAGDETATDQPEHDRAGSTGTGPEAEIVTENMLVQILTNGRVDILALPVASLSDDGFAYVEAVPRLRTGHGRHLEPAEYRALAARWGLTAEVDRLLLRRCMAMVGSTLAKGQEVRALCSIAATSLNDPDLLTTLRRLVDDPELAERLIITVDRARLHRPAWAELARLIEEGLNVCLRRLSIETIDLRGLADGGFAFVKLDTPRHALASTEDKLPPALGKLQQRFARSAITVLVDLRAEPALVGSTDATVFTGSRAAGKEAAASAA